MKAINVDSILKKEYYLKSSNKEAKVHSWLKICEEFKSFKPFSLDLNRAALLVFDMQNYFLDRASHAYIPSVETIIPSINSLIEVFNNKNSRVVFTRHFDNNDPLDSMKKMWRDSIIRDSELFKIDRRINKGNGIIIDKTKYSAFYGTGLDNYLRNNSVEQVVITGVHSHLCCESSARDAFLRNYEVFYVVDATATYLEQLHLGTLRAIAHGFGVCTTLEEIITDEHS